MLTLSIYESSICIFRAHSIIILYHKYIITFIGTSPVCFGKYYNWFKKYWHYEREREINYSSFDIFIRTEAIFVCLEQEWNKNKWNIKELKWICSQINYDNKMIDTNLFLDDPAAYIVHVKNCFYLAQTNF